MTAPEPLPSATERTRVLASPTRLDKSNGFGRPTWQLCCFTIGKAARLITGDITVRGAGRHLPRLSEPVRNMSSARVDGGRNGRAGNLMTPRREVSEVRRNLRRKKEMSERGKGDR